MEAMTRLRPGDYVALRAPAAVQATLDQDGCLEGVPFMPEMLAYFGRRLRVAKRVEKICDTICPIASRRMRGTVFLEDVRCGGGDHGGCEAECRIYWKEAWLQPMPDAAAAAPGHAGLAQLAGFLQTRRHQPGSGGTLWRCQATEARRASEPMGTWSVAQYVREIRGGNVTPARFLRVAARALVAGIAAKGRRLLGRPLLRGLRRGSAVEVAALDLQPGEWVEVRSREEIAATLDRRMMHRGMLFAASEMLPACGKRFRVRRRVRRIVDEASGRMLEMKHGCVVLEGFVCTGDRSHRRWFCAREIYPYWREAWLKRVAVAPPVVAQRVEPVSPDH